MAIAFRPQTDTPRTTKPEAPVTQSGVLILQRSEGLQRYPWSTDDPASVHKARTAFTDFQAAGYRLYRTDTPDKVAEEIKEFTTQAREVLGIMPLRGGEA